MRPTFSNRNCSSLHWILSVLAFVSLCIPTLSAAQQSTSKKPEPGTSGGTAGPRTFDSPQQAANVLVDAAEKFDVVTLAQIFGRDGEDIVFSGEFAQDRKHAADFAAQAREKKSVAVDPTTRNRAFVLVGEEDWPFPVPIVKHGEKWSFDAKAGSQELLYRRIGANELDAIQICHGYVEAQYDYAFEKREGYDVNQYAQRIVSTPGKQDGLYWKTAEGDRPSPLGPLVTRAAGEGYSKSEGPQPYHGYYFRPLRGQGAHAKGGALDYVVKGHMIGGFAAIAYPARYASSGVMTFIVNHDGVVYQKDLGPDTAKQAAAITRFDPGDGWTAVPAP